MIGHQDIYKYLYPIICAAIVNVGAFESALAEGEKSFKSRGLVRSQARVELRTDLMAMVTDANFQEGMKFKKGDNLVSFDCRKHQAELNSARAASSGADIELRNKVTLHKNGAAGKSEVSLARAAASKATHDVKALKARMNYCSIGAPFSGRVVALNVRSMEMPSADKPLMVIIDDSSLELELVVPSVWLSWLKTGTEFSFLVDETQREYLAAVKRLGAEVDPVSQTIKVYAQLSGDLEGVLAGMSGAATFQNAGI